MNRLACQNLLSSSSNFDFKIWLWTLVRRTFKKQASSPVFFKIFFILRLDSTIHWINYSWMDSAVQFVHTYPLDSDSSIGQQFIH